VAGRLQLPGQVLKPGRVQLGEVGAGVARIRDPHLDLATPEVRGKQFAQWGVDMPQFVGQAQVQVQVAAVDAAQFQGKGALCEVGAGVAESSHAADHENVLVN